MLREPIHRPLNLLGGILDIAMNGPSGLTREMSALDSFRISLQIIGSALSIYGVFWVFVQFLRKKILRNTAGFLIVSISIADLLASLQYAYTAFDYIFMFWRFLDSSLSYYLGIWMYHVFNWSLLSAAQWELTLAIHTLYVIQGGACAYGNSIKWVMVIGGIIGPILYFFVPISLYTHEPLFAAWTNDQGVNYFLLAAITILLVVGLSTFYMIWRNLHIYTIKYVQGTKMPSAAANLVLRIVMVYSLSMLVAFGPFWLKTLLFTIDTTNTETDYIRNYPWSFGTCVLLLKDLTSPFRGYIHALAVYYVYKNTNSNHSLKRNRIKYYLEYIFLVDFKSPQRELEKEQIQNEQVPQVNPHWSFTFKSQLVDSFNSRPDTQKEESYLDILDND